MAPRSTRCYTGWMPTTWLSIRLPEGSATMPRTRHPTFETLLVHSTIAQPFEQWLRGHGIHLDRANDIREGDVRVVKLTPAGARTIRGG